MEVGRNGGNRNAMKDFFYLVSKGSGVAAFVRTWMEVPTLHILTNVAT